MKTREEVQSEALKELEKTQFKGTIVLSTGTGKSKVAIDAMRKGKFLNVLITSPRTNLKDNWRTELQKWNFALTTNSKVLDLSDSDYFPNVFLENIQTCYKWEENTIQELDLIIADEIHTMVTEEYGKLLVKASKLGIPVIGLTATPDDEKFEKDIFYSNYCPIIYRYENSAVDGIINQRKYLTLSYSLTDTFEVMTGPKKKRWSVGEEKQYTYLTGELLRGQRLMSATGSEEWFEDASNWFWKGLGDTQQKTAARVYLQAITHRKNFLWNLSSSAYIAKQVKEMILKSSEDNKVLIFSEHTSQAEKLSPYCIHSKSKDEVNQELLKMFNTDEIKELSSVRSLTLGLNMSSPKYAIMESFTSSTVQFKQKAGRTDRLPIDETATVIWIVPKNTQAEKWYRSATKVIGESSEMEVIDLDVESLTSINF